MQMVKKSRMKFPIIMMVATLSLAIVLPVRAESGLNAKQLVEIAIEMNPQLKAAKAQWDVAEHQILQNYAPADPTFNYGLLDSDRDFDAAQHSHAINFNFNFPGEALLQVEQARRTAAVARLTYEAAVRDLRAGVETAYYQVLLDQALIEINRENIANLQEVLEVTRTAYMAQQAAQNDFLTARIALSQAQLQQEQYETNRYNDKTNLNQLLYRDPDTPLELNQALKLEAVKLPLMTAIDMATRTRQEILEAALSERNTDTALELAKMEYLPNYSVGLEYDTLLEPGTRPNPNVHQGFSFNLGFTVPVFFWIHQSEDVKAARSALAAARYNLSYVRTQTRANVSTLYRSSQYAYKAAQLYKESLIQLANQNFQVGLIAYQSQKIDFLTLSSTLQSAYATRAAYLQNVNQLLAGEVALEQAIGAPLQ
jgi:cobalt-zinc-cadmium efflux system outer membrane protein